MKAEMKLITPDLAREYLQKNIVNRNISIQHVRGLMKDIINNNWVMSPQGISFNDEGILIDGQHRLSAVIMANKPITSLVFFDVPKNVFTVLDTGKRRNAGDVLSIAAVKNCNNIASGIRTWDKVRRGIYSNAGSADINISNTSILDLYNFRPEFWQWAHKHSIKLYEASLRIVSPQIIFAMVSHWQDKNESLAYIESVLENDGKEINSKGLYKLLTNYKLKKKILTQADTFKLFFKYHNLSKKGVIAKQFLIIDNENIVTF